MSAGVIRWEDPPPTREHAVSTFDSRTVAKQLRSRPGVWALVAVNPASTGLATLINSGGLAAFRPPQSFESKWRTADGERRCYARYVGDP